MFRIKNQANGKEQTFPNRDALLVGLEGEENRCLQLNMSATFYLFHTDKQGEVLDSIELTVPSAEDTSIKDLLGQFGFKKEDKKGVLSRFSRKRTAEEQKTKQKEKQVSANQPHQGGRLFKGMLWILPMVLSLTSFMLAFQKALVTAPVRHQDSSKETITVIDHGPDVFARYFISAYFSASDNRQAFISDTLSIDDLSTPKTTPTSVLLESQKTKANITRLTYVITIRDTQDKMSSKRLKLTVKQSKDADYGYLVTKKPQLTVYPDEH
ncbi:hypothetical protein [Streptococcus thoraltensis]|uniref:hypothetical protein n=1 Tax=Streptococcus thoraltensis TaxID=55085 RepID=UPI001F58089F|nr:hypothetical protein [Streptococcus thoraltensis]